MKKNKFIITSRFAIALLLGGLLLLPVQLSASLLRSYTITVQMETATLKDLFDLIDRELFPNYARLLI